MKFATVNNNTLDGGLLLVSDNRQQAIDVSHIAPNLWAALQNWTQVEGDLQRLYQQLNTGALSDTMAFDAAICRAPMPRSAQWLDASAFLNHARLMEQAFNTPAIPDFDTIPVVYQGASDNFLGPCEDVPLPSEADGIDFEGEFGVIVDDVPMGVSAQAAADHIRLIVQINDWSLRHFGPREMQTGFGFLLAKPSSSFAPLAVTPDELGDAWTQGRVKLDLCVDWNGDVFGRPNGQEMNYSFPELIAHCARTRRLSAGTIIGSGTVSNRSREAGSACIAERRVLEKIELGEIQTSFMRFGDRVRMEARTVNGDPGPFGVIDQRVVCSE
ncbi:fumarylacetoacetate hydrolase family protein [Gynuella sunshinyii]|uniref:2-keto-4-pentenoate hydratase/2-oxohepta-3-ene-1,7-dioic acid hydratase (Catechol pathway) n=1 Tax=Gynuella sunshinyii YC6258 TaxID=1445510 RepID=A0A0C5V8I1_9GAMM|nr:fumarylacetoacetate hydrolase family protein [Gynuella sunshinyii]AJQ95690.1 2-keto-4-pentenoate hydratase/2-oxohepta-3-ene-1,7-dioic acid hydratase (catechol pathway) [Gynuella sunshinyii YC6258]